MQRADSFERTQMLGGIGVRRRGWQRMRWLDGITNLMHMVFWWTLAVGDEQGGLACCSSWGCKELDMTEQLNWIELTYLYEGKIGILQIPQERLYLKTIQWLNCNSELFYSFGNILIEWHLWELRITVIWGWRIRTSLCHHLTPDDKQEVFLSFALHFWALPKHSGSTLS